MHKKELLIKQVQVHKSLTVTNIHKESSIIVTKEIIKNYNKEKFCHKILLKQSRIYKPRSYATNEKRKSTLSNPILGRLKKWGKKIFSFSAKMNTYIDIFVQTVSILSDTEKIVSGIYGIIDSLFHNS